MQKALIDIIILTFNRKKELTQILNKLQEQTIKDFNVIITDDGSDELINPNNFPFIKRYLWHYNDAYHRVARFNEALEIAISDKIILLDDDCIPQHNSFLETHINNLNHFDISRGVVNFPDGSNGSSWFSTANIGFRREKIKAFGLFDYNFDGHYGHEDQDLRERLKKSDFTLSEYLPTSSVLHIGAFYANGDRSEKIIGHNTKYFIEKWGYDPR